MDNQTFSSAEKLDELNATQGQVGPTPINMVSILDILKNQRQHIIKNLAEVNEKIILLERQPQWVLDIINKIMNHRQV